jgi:hypothetical protein
MPSRGAFGLVAVLAASLLAVSEARASCNVIPPTDRAFPSTIGSVSRPFARPGDHVELTLGATPFFAPNAGGNVVRLRFSPPGQAETSVDLPACTAATCELSDCSPAGCRRLRFTFPDTDALVTQPGDGQGLTGPVSVTVERGGVRTAAIDALFLEGGGFRNPLFPSFVALPRANRVADLVLGLRHELLAAEDTAGNLLVPLDFRPLVDADERRARLIDAVIPGIASTGTLAVEVFTPAGQRLPPLVRAVNDHELVGTADAAESVLRIEKGALRPGFGPKDGKGPIVIPGVAAFADPTDRADLDTTIVGDRFAVYETRECVPVTGGGLDCVDIDGNGSVDDYHLVALDLTLSRATPVIVHTIDAKGLAGYPNGVPAPLYSFDATDSVVAYWISEDGDDLDGDGTPGEVLASGAFDLLRGVDVPLAAGSPRIAVAGTQIVFSVPTAAAGPDVLHRYDAASADPGPHPIPAPGGGPLEVTRHPVGAARRGIRTWPFDFAITPARVAAVVPEAVHGADLTGDGDLLDQALVLFDTATGTTTSLMRAMTPQFDVARLAMSLRWLAFQATRSGRFGSYLSVGVIQVDQAQHPLEFICDEDIGPGLVVPSLSDTVIPCTKMELLRVLTRVPGAVSDDQLDSAIAVADVDDVQVAGDVLVVGVTEAAQIEDLNGDGDFDDIVLHVFHAVGRTLTNFGIDVVRSSPPFLRFIRRGLVAVSRRAGLVRNILRDVDEDGVLEEFVGGPNAPGTSILDNCPSTPNPDQRDVQPQDGIGDVCQCPRLDVGTVQAFEGSHALVPVDLDPGATRVSSLNFTLRYADASSAAVAPVAACVEGPVVTSADAELTCAISDATGVTTFVANAPRIPIPEITPGEVASYDVELAPGTAGATIRVCVAPSESAFGDPEGKNLCVGPPTCGEIRVDPACHHQGDCNCDGKVNSGDRVCLVSKFFDQSLRATCPCEDCNQSGELDAADAPCITLCTFGACSTARRQAAAIP